MFSFKFSNFQEFLQSAKDLFEQERAQRQRMAQRRKKEIIIGEDVSFEFKTPKANVF